MKIGIKLREEDATWNVYIDKIRNFAEVEIFYGPRVIGQYPKVNALLTTNLSEDELDCFPDLKAVFLFKTGMDQLPVKIMESRGITVSASYANSDNIAEHAIALTLSLLHRITEFDSDLRNNIWFANGKDYYWKSLTNMKVGIYGYGHIGKAIRHQLTSFTRNVKVLNKSGIYDNDVIPAHNLYELVAWSDLLYICVPKNEETIGTINASLLKNMHGKYIVNISRAEICDEKNLYDALVEKNLEGYASDVWFINPNKNDRTLTSPISKYDFTKLKNVVMTPHCATHEIHAHERYVADATEQCIQYIRKHSNDSF